MERIKISPQNPHIIIQGKPRTGKTTLAEEISKAQENSYIRWLDVKKIKSVKQALEFEDFLYDMEKEIEDRLELLENSNKPNIDEYRKEKDIENIVFIIDDVDYFINNLNTQEEVERLTNKLYKILRIGSAVGINVIITTQIQPWVLIPKYKDLIFTTVNTVYDSGDYKCFVNIY